MEIKNISSALSSETRLRILKILSASNLSSIDVHKEYIQKYPDKKHRESIYRELEILHTAGLLEKKYNSEGKQIEYGIKIKKFTIDLITQNIKL